MVDEYLQRPSFSFLLEVDAGTARCNGDGVSNVEAR